MLTADYKRKAFEGDVVELLEDYPRYNLRKGQRGIVITEFDEPEEAYDLEIEDAQGNFSGFAYSVKPEHILNLTRDAFESGFRHLEEGELLAAKKEFEYAIELRPGLIGTLHNVLMSNLAKAEAWETGVVFMNLLLELNPFYEHARDSLAISYLNWGVQVANQGRATDALYILLRASAVTSDPEINDRIRWNFAATYWNLGVAAFRKGNIDETRGLMRAACAYYPSQVVRENLAVACIHAAHFYMANGRFEQAVDAFEEAEQIGLVWSNFINDYGIALTAVGRHDDARRAFDRALALAPNDAVIKANLNRLLRQEPADSFEKEEKKYDFVPIELVAQSVQVAAMA
jgi:tetratricopeptide (TPR) repeat protein